MGEPEVPPDGGERDEPRVIDFSGGITLPPLGVLFGRQAERES